MFGESESESPRVGSPWDSLMTSTPPPPPVDNELEMSMKTRLGESFPKLVPEVEYGNVEYKLKLLNPSPERFTRLVTQLKWRLLEGGGQAYYELGVADSGQLIGLSRRDLEASLETLEMMAGDIGASVIIVKEIEVPAALVGRGMNFALGIPERTPGRDESELDANVSTATETSATEDDDDALDTPPSDSEPALPILSRQTHFNTALEIEIASVYKPRPHRSRPLPITQTRYTKRGSQPKTNSKPRRQQRSTEAESLVRAEEKRVKRDTRRDTRRRALLAPDIYMGQRVAEGVSGFDADMEGFQFDTQAPVPCVVSDPQALLPALEALALNGNMDGSEAETPAITITDASASPVMTHEPRLIVEALVVRKLALEEAFLDFGGFALEI